jgi:hypothetical protein
MRRVSLLLLAVALLVGGCNRQADVSQPTQYRDHGLAFDYPKNWQITKDEQSGSIRFIHVEGPGSVLTVFSVFGPDPVISLDTFATDYVENMKKGVPFDMFKLAGQTVTPAGGIDVRYSIKVAGIDVPFTTNLFRRELGTFQVIGITQISDEDRHFVQAGFDLILKSLAASPPISGKQ